MKKDGSETCDLPTAARRLGIGRTSAYKLAKSGKFPAPVIRVGRLWRVPQAPLDGLLGVCERREGR